MPETKEQITRVLVLQGGGALGAYQAGAYEELASRNYRPDYVAGISIGAINAAIIAGNKPSDRLARLQQFWNKITSHDQAASFVSSLWGGLLLRAPLNMASANAAMLAGVPGFFSPRIPPYWLQPCNSQAAISVYDTEPLKETLKQLVDFDILNSGEVRCAVGAVNVETGNMTWFDNTKMKLTVEHVMASGALPPGFPPINIDGAWYWDGGIVSNAPLQYVLGNHDLDGMVAIFQVDLFSAHGFMPTSMQDVENREKDIRFSSRTRFHTDQISQLLEALAMLQRLYDKLPKDLQDDPETKALMALERGLPDRLLIAQLIYRQASHETQNRDYEFSRLSMDEHWQTGRNDAAATLNHPDFLSWATCDELLRIIDYAGSKTRNIASGAKRKTRPALRGKP